MSYKYTFNNDHNYLAHFNKNHSKANGQFISGDGDGDGVVDDHHNYAQNKQGDTSGSNVEGELKNKKKFDKSSAIGAGIVIAAGAAVIGYKLYSAYKDYKIAKQNTEAINNMAEEWYIKYKAANAKVVGGDW